MKLEKKEKVKEEKKKKKLSFIVSERDNESVFTVLEPSGVLETENPSPLKDGVGESSTLVSVRGTDRGFGKGGRTLSWILVTYSVYIVDTWVDYLSSEKNGV